MENLLNLLFPPKCNFCGKGTSVFCTSCLAQCKKLTHQYCVICDSQSLYGLTHISCLGKTGPTQTLSVFEYDGLVSGCIKRSKYGPKHYMSLKVLIRYAFSLIRLHKYFQDFLLIPIPISPRKLIDRGFNQVELITDEISKIYNVPVFIEVLKRVKDTPPQHGMSREERFNNVINAFTTDPMKLSVLKGKKIMLVDDICTTGATLLSASKVLMEEGAKEVKCFTLAKKVFSGKSRVPSDV